MGVGAAARMQQAGAGAAAAEAASGVGCRGGTPKWSLGANPLPAPRRFVQCYSCGNPETVIKIRKKNETIELKCKACGHVRCGAGGIAAGARGAAEPRERGNQAMPGLCAVASPRARGCGRLALPSAHWYCPPVLSPCFVLLLCTAAM